MKANVVFIHQRHPRAVLQCGHREFYVVESRRRVDLSRDDDISGDFALHDVKWMFNISRGELIHVKVLARHVTLRAAMEAVPSLAGTGTPR